METLSAINITVILAHNQIKTVQVLYCINVLVEKFECASWC
ncbi:hypothetical protein BAZMOX_26544_1 [methanotrophic endosymbiont of Bathymodiolus azoricus (Menez Gwen)]|nr:hypothetical protein BAZMOX_26544_1 [methanotrophic endosymbiont of Bathymodiolus azoricus (Menez Gwen)]